MTQETRKAQALSGAYKRYPELVLDEVAPEDVAHMFEMAVLLNTEYKYSSFVHKMLLQGAYAIRKLLTPAPDKPKMGDDVREALDDDLQGAINRVHKIAGEAIEYVGLHNSRMAKVNGLNANDVLRLLNAAKKLIREVTEKYGE